MDRLGLPVDRDRQLLLADYAALLVKWNRTFNLLGATSIDDLIDLHLIDALTTLPTLQRWLGGGSNELIDVGSGAGLPGLALAIARPQWALTLAEPVNKKTAFLRQAAGALRLPNVTVFEGRIESLTAGTPSPHFICRALTTLDRFRLLCRPAAGDDSLLFAMKSAGVQREIEALPTEAEVLAIEPLATARPGLARTLVVLAAEGGTRARRRPPWP